MAKEAPGNDCISKTIRRSAPPGSCEIGKLHKPQHFSFDVISAAAFLLFGLTPRPPFNFGNAIHAYFEVLNLSSVYSTYLLVISFSELCMLYLKWCDDRFYILLSI